MIHPDDRAQLLALKHGNPDQTGSWDIEFRVLWPKHEMRWIRAKGSLVPNDSGPPTSATGICMDITERKLAENALRSSQQRLELAQSAAGIASFERDIAIGVVRCSKAFPALYGLPPSEVGPLHEEWLELIHPEDRGKVIEQRTRAIEGADAWEMEFRVIWPDGSVHWLLSKGLLQRDSQGLPTHIVGVNMDITERKQAEETLRSSQRRLELAQAAAGVATYDWDTRTHVGHCSKEFPAMYGLPSAEVGPPYQQWLEMIHPDDRARILLEREKSLDSSNDWDTEFRVIWPDGSIHWLYARGNVLRDEHGNPTHLIGVNLDITARKRAEHESVARQKLEGLGVLAGGIAHDFNNLLGTILAESELLLDEVGDSPAVSTAVANITAVVDRASEIVRELMVYAGNEETELAPLDLSELVREMLQLLRVSISKQAALEADLPEGLRRARANGAQVAQVVMNLITNASEALGDKPGVISVSIVESEDHIRLAFSDTGCGMTDEVKARIFDPFFSTKFAGRGMGLAAVQGIIRKHGGTIDVASVPGKGSLFTILLPAISEPAPNEHPRSSAESSSPREDFGGTVLVIEDEQPLRHAVLKSLRKRGFDVIEASDGRAGVDQFVAHHLEIDTVLLDMTLPGLSGPEVLRELQRIRPDIKVILTTAYSQENALAALGDCQPWGFIRKPYRLDALAELLRTACRQKSR